MQTLDVDYVSLGHILQVLTDDPLIQSSTELADRVKNALLFHESMSKEVNQLIEENQRLRLENALIYSNGSSANGSELEQITLERYSVIKAAGGTIDLIANIARHEGLDEFMRARILVRLFGISWQEAATRA